VLNFTFVQATWTKNGLLGKVVGAADPALKKAQRLVDKINYPDAVKVHRAVGERRKKFEKGWRASREGVPLWRARQTYENIQHDWGNMSWMPGKYYSDQPPVHQMDLSR
jgi:hypothetical protein